MIKAVHRSNKRNLYDLKVKSTISNVSNLSLSLREFETKFNELVKTMVPSCGYSYENSYKCIRKDWFLQVWHRNTNGINDRLISEVYNINYENLIH